LTGNLNLSNLAKIDEDELFLMYERRMGHGGIIFAGMCRVSRKAKINYSRISISIL
jgi:hypothetical protein